jgi:hypothetical protein
VGLLIKHSSSRLTPWLFTFTGDHLSELKELQGQTRACFVGLVCHKDGFVCVRESQLSGIFPHDASAVSVRVDRRPRKMYRVSSSGTALDSKVAKGVGELVEELRQ